MDITIDLVKYTIVCSEEEKYFIMKGLNLKMNEYHHSADDDSERKAGKILTMLQKIEVVSQGAI